MKQIKKKDKHEQRQTEQRENDSDILREKQDIKHKNAQIFHVCAQKDRQTGR